MENPLVELLHKKLAEMGKAHPLMMAAMAKETINLTASIITDFENRIARLERQNAADQTSR